MHRAARITAPHARAAASERGLVQPLRNAALGVAFGAYIKVQMLKISHSSGVVDGKTDNKRRAQAAR